MEQNYNLTDILKSLTDAINNPVMKTIRSASVSVLENVKPIVGIAAGVVDNFLSEYNAFKFSLLLKGLSTKLSIEKKMNELYNYVNSCPEKAIIVANLFRKTVNSECPKVCIIYGLILSNHIGSNTEFTQDELIVCKALENATECDLINFKEIMEKYLNENRIVFPKGFTNLAEFITTCDWCVYNRIFISRINEWQKIEDEILGITTPYYVAKPASVLMKYINDARQIWDY